MQIYLYCLCFNSTKNVNLKSKISELVGCSIFDICYLFLQSKKYAMCLAKKKGLVYINGYEECLYFAVYYMPYCFHFHCHDAMALLKLFNYKIVST